MVHVLRSRWFDGWILGKWVLRFGTVVSVHLGQHWFLAGRSFIGRRFDASPEAQLRFVRLSPAQDVHGACQWSESSDVASCKGAISLVLVGVANASFWNAHDLPCEPPEIMLTLCRLALCRFRVPSKILPWFGVDLARSPENVIWET